ncbi:hypothetical protein E5F05_02410 (plasmid) [Deinococcus metallilatus]|uniref:Uncharacterized protein n=1 Tax=Deinococcus metallilatus TaxID=1211322 RepID=A0ABR6MUY5_9DEIO|nr:hypothetical protein [Deinococcus metallilatus]MBB5295745.1 hypothetical protein [Deinococcus metallilatus]QBY06813.1 hypothetical protein E5F05_02410 [Deinococcus metallilatus]GMA14274.1 hypothetical protein GCM10025871_06050 [Deinococcus metallilatus]
MHELLCTWVPGTLDVVRLSLPGRTLELKDTRLARIFGPQALNDLYLKGRAILKADPQQVALLA